MSTQWFVIAPRQTSGQDLPPSGHVDTRLIVECEHPETADGLVRQVADLVAARRRGQHAGGQPSVDLRTVFRRLDEFASRSAFISFAMRSSASFHEIGSHLSEPGARYSGCVRRFAVDEVDQARALRAQRAAIDGWSGSPSMWMMLGRAFSRRLRGCTSGCRNPLNSKDRCCAFRRCAPACTVGLRQALRTERSPSGLTRSGKRRSRHLQELAPGHL